jgi:putative aminopeptidase FrvX
MRRPFPHAARDMVIAAAQRAGVPYQLAVTSGGVTDAAAAHLAGAGVATLEVKIPAATHTRPSNCSTYATLLPLWIW